MSANKDKKKKRKKKTALIICKDRKEFWTTQTQFWQWVRDGVVTKTDDNPLTGTFKREHEELLVLLSNTVLNLAHPNHMREALLSRRVGLARKLNEVFMIKKMFASSIVAVAACFAALFSASGQQPEQAAANKTVAVNGSRAQTAPASNEEDRYRIGAGDVLDIRILNRPNLSREAVRVEGNGVIRMPLIEDRKSVV